MSEQKENKSLTESKPRQLIRRPATESAAGYRALRVLATTMFHTLLPVRYRHLERAQLDAPFIVIGNHLSILDPIIVAAAIKRYEVAFMGKNELSSNGLFKRFLLSIHVIFVNRHNSDMEAMRTSMRALRSGEVLGIFPEGTRFHKGLMEEQEAGAAMIALRSGVPMIPMYIDRRLALFRPVTCVVGEPIPMDDLREKGINKETCQELMARITQTYQKLAQEAAQK